MLANYQAVTLSSGDTINIKYLKSGSGNKTLIVLHPSPLSANFMKPFIQLASQAGYQVYAWDAPGYGDSEALPTGGETLQEYTDALAKFMSSLNISSAAIYGNATGAQIAIEFSKAYPDLCDRVLLENAALFTDKERTEFFQHYFPDLSPKEDGSHLTLTWQMVNQLFQYFPWYDTSEQAKLASPIPPIEVIQATFNDYLKAGTGYANAYKAALNNERPEQIQAVTCKTDILLWQSSIIKKYCDRLLDIELPENIKLHQAETGMNARFDKLTELLKQP